MSDNNNLLLPIGGGLIAGGITAAVAKKTPTVEQAKALVTSADYKRPENLTEEQKKAFDTFEKEAKAKPGTVTATNPATAVNASEKNLDNAIKNEVNNTFASYQEIDAKELAKTKSEHNAEIKSQETAIKDQEKLVESARREHKLAVESNERLKKEMKDFNYYSKRNGDYAKPSEYQQKLRDAHTEELKTAQTNLNTLNAEKVKLDEIDEKGLAELKEKAGKIEEKTATLTEKKQKLATLEAAEPKDTKAIATAKGEVTRAQTALDECTAAKKTIDAKRTIEERITKAEKEVKKKQAKLFTPSEEKAAKIKEEYEKIQKQVDTEKKKLEKAKGKDAQERLQRSIAEKERKIADLKGQEGRLRRMKIDKDDNKIIRNEIDEKIGSVKNKEGVSSEEKEAFKKLQDAEKKLLEEKTKLESMKVRHSLVESVGKDGKITKEAFTTSLKNAMSKVETSTKSGLEKSFEAVKGLFKAKTNWGKAALIGGITFAVLGLGKMLLGGKKKEQPEKVA